MTENTIPLIISALIGLLTGAIGSLVAPWVSWGIEKRKFKRKIRINLIKELRDYLRKNTVQNNDFLSSYMYLRIRPFLSNSLIDDLESSTVVLHVNDTNPLSEYNAKFFYELDNIERKWGLGIGKGKSRNKMLYNQKKSGIHITVEPADIPDTTTNPTKE